MCTFAVVLWEIYTQGEPWEDCEDIDAVIDTVLAGRRPSIPSTCPGVLRDLIELNWSQHPQSRLDMETTVNMLNLL